MGLNREQLQDLATTALTARERSYAPYSGFNTGAAVLTENGSTYRGVLVENLIFGLAMCAERVALFAAVSESGEKPVALAIAAPATAGRRTFPCGSCLQVAVELGGIDIQIISVDPDSGDFETRTIADLAPGLPYRKNPGAGKL